MQLAKVQTMSGETRVGVVRDGHVRLLDLGETPGLHRISDLLHAGRPEELVRDLVDDEAPTFPMEELTVLPPIDDQEVWGAGVTYERSHLARRTESLTAASVYDQVYEADRPELFFKATPHRVVGHGGRVRIRRDTRWTVPEPELALVITPRMRLVGYTIGNDMSARDIEGTNPLYLPQAKIYEGCCALGPVVTLATELPSAHRLDIQMTIAREGETVFQGSTNVAKMTRSFTDLIGWLARDNSFPRGVVLLTGTGIVPPDDFSLQPGDKIMIRARGIGTLTNIVSLAGSPKDLG